MRTKLTVAEEIRLAATGEMEARRLLGKPSRPFATIVLEAIAPSRLIVQPPALPSFMWRL